MRHQRQDAHRSATATMNGKHNSACLFQRVAAHQNGLSMMN
jgi:hypothetical protein